MKKFILFAGALLGSVASNAQSANPGYLDINNIKAKVNADGSLFWDFANGKFEAPKGSGRHTIFANALWVGGFDASNALKVAGQTYRQTGTDFWPGPLNSLAIIDSATIADFDRVWKLNQCDIEAFNNWVLSGSTGVNPIDSAANEAIMNWPTLTPDGAPLAPFNDANTNGVYEPLAGDVPLIKGDQSIFFVCNDKGGIHGETGGTAIGLEFQVMVYGYSCPDDSALYNTIFTNYKIINKSSFRLDSAFIGNWTDFDIGSPTDDFVGCDVTRGAYYAYNGDMVDDFPPAGLLAYGANPPAQAVTFLAGPYATANGVDDLASSTANGTNYGDGITDNERLGMSKFMYFNNDGSVTGNPSGALDFYNYLSGTWRDATPMTYGGTGHLTGVPCDYMLPATSDPLGFGTNGVPQPAWDETTTGNLPGDRRGLGSYGPFTFQPGAVHELDFAYVYARATSGGNLASVTVMQERIDSIRQKFNGPMTACGCSISAGITNSSNEILFTIYPNPATENITVQFTTGIKNGDARIYDAKGKMVRNISAVNSDEQIISLTGLENGLYLITVNNGKSLSTKRFIKQ